MAENGEVYVDKYSKVIVDNMKQIQLQVYIYFYFFLVKYLLCISNEAEIFTLGCFYRDQSMKNMPMYGSVTDAQVFSRELSDQEMVDMTSCK